MMSTDGKLCLLHAQVMLITLLLKFLTGNGQQFDCVCRKPSTDTIVALIESTVSVDRYQRYPLLFFLCVVLS